MSRSLIRLDLTRRRHLTDSPAEHAHSTGEGGGGVGEGFVIAVYIPLLSFYVGVNRRLRVVVY